MSGKSLVAAVAAAVSLGGCVAGNATTAPDKKAPGLLANEAVSSVSYTGSSVRAMVMGTGCTKSADFVIESSVSTGVRCELLIVRSSPDQCRKAPAPTEIAVDFEAPPACAGLPLMIANPLLATPAEALLESLSTQ